jgi:hypothetical protein
LTIRAAAADLEANGVGSKNPEEKFFVSYCRFSLRLGDFSGWASEKLLNFFLLLSVTLIGD